MTLNTLKKIIKYRSTYSGTKETDILYEKIFIRNLDKFNQNDLNTIKSIFNFYTDDQIYQILNNKSEPNQKYKKFFNKIKNI